MLIGYEYMLPGENDSGVELAIRQLLDALITLNRDHDHDFEVYTRHQSMRHLPHDSRLHAHPSGLASTSRLGRIAWQQGMLPLRLRAKPVDLYHATGYIASPLLPAPTVVSVYDTIALETPALTRRSNAAHYRLTLPGTLRAAQKIIVPSHYVKNRLLALTHTKAEKIAVVPLGIGAHFTRIHPAKPRAQLAPLGAWTQGKYILALGNIEAKKNFRLVLHAFAKLPETLRKDLHLVIAGKPCGEIEALIHEAAALGIAQRLVFTGYVNDATLVALYNAAALFVYPSLDEGFGLPPLEAMACGCPVLASNAGALPETTGGHATLLSPTDPEAWTSAIKKVLVATVPQPSIPKAVAYAHTFRWSTTAHAVMKIYEDCAKR